MAQTLSKDKQTASRQDTERSLIDWDHLLLWQKDNDFILTGYRRASFSARTSLASILMLHNETVNIWSHGLGFIFYGYFLFFPDAPVLSRSDYMAFGVYYVSVVICFVISSSFHTFLNHSPEVWKVCSQLDHLGIVVVILGSTIASKYFGFYCNASLRNTYITLAVTTGRQLRSLVYGLLGLTAFASAAHGVVTNGWHEQNQRQSLSHFTGLGLLNGLGTFIYAARVPERWFPRTLDMFGSSHQIMHVLVMLGAYSHSVGLHKAMRYWQANHVQSGSCS